MRSALGGIARSAGGVLGSLLFSVAAAKTLALVYGAGGIGAYGQLKNLQQSLVTVGTLNGQSALIQGVASRSGRARWALAAGALQVMFAMTACLVVAALVASPAVANVVLGSTSPEAVGAIGLTIVGGALYVVSSAGVFIVTGLSRLGAAAAVQVTGAAGLLLGLPAIAWSRTGALAGGVMVLAGGAVSVAAAWRTLGSWSRRRLQVGWRLARSERRESVRAFLSLGLGMAVGGAIGAGGRLVVRAVVVERGGIAAAGAFEVAWTISMTYMGVLLGSLGGYLLPALSSAGSRTQQSRLLSEFLRLAVAISVPLVIGVLAFSREVIALLYASSLLDASGLLSVMVIGDLFKLVSWVLVMPMLAAGDVRWFVLFELVWNVLFVSCVLVAPLGALSTLDTVGFAFVLGYVVNTIGALLYCVLRRGLALHLSALGVTATGAGVVVLGRILSVQQLPLAARIGVVGLAAGAAIVMVGREGRQALTDLLTRRVRA